MDGLNVDWTRYWYPKNSIAYLSDNGYLHDPAGDIGKYYNEKSTELNKLDDVGCLILLGEPGSGKSTELHKARQQLLDQNIVTSDQVLWFDLGEFNGDYRLCDEIFNNEAISEWLNSDYLLYLFLDGFDECLIRIETLPDILSKKLKGLPLERLHLRIACRSNVWPSYWEDEVIKFWPDQNYRVYMLAPLKEEDVKQAANKKKIDGQKFLNDVRLLQVESLARKPATLEILFQLYNSENGFPQSATELYYYLCLRLCTEVSPKRYGLKIDGQLTGEERLAIASRIAAISVFGNIAFISKGMHGSNLAKNCLHFEDVCGGTEFTRIDKVKVGRDELKEAIEMTGFFDLEKDNTFSWVDAKIQNFLAALYLQRRGITLDKIEELIIHPHLSEKNVIPQFEKTVEWLVSLVPELFDELLSINPMLLVRSDLSKVNQERLGYLVQETLKYYKRPGIPPGFRLNVFQHYHKLRHSELAEQLERYIVDSNEIDRVRYEAILIARECKLKEVQETVLNIAKDDHESIHLRTVSIRALEIFADEAIKAQLKELLTRDEGVDKDDELKGCILSCLWPSSISAEEIFLLLTPKKKVNLIGTYHMFLKYELAKHLQVTDLKYAFQWLASGVDESLSDSVEDVFVSMSLENLTNEQVFEDFVQWIVLRIKQHESIVPHSLEKHFSELIKNNSLRMKIISKAIDIGKEQQIDLVYSRPAILHEEDIPWLLSEISKNDEDINKQKYLAHLLSWLVDSSKPELINRIYDVLRDRKPLQEQFQWLFGVIMLGSQQEAALKTEYLRRQEWDKRGSVRSKKPIDNSSNQKTLDDLLEKLEQGEALTWSQIDSILRTSYLNERQDYTWKADITALPGWKNAGEVLKEKISQYAISYVEEWTAKPETWWKTDSFSSEVFSDYRALQLVLDYEQVAANKYELEVWEKWAPFILSYPVFGDIEKEGKRYREIVSKFYAIVPKKIIEALIEIIDYENKKGHIFVLDKIEYCWDQHLQTTILAKIKEDKNLQPSSIEKLLEALLEQNVDVAFSYAEELYKSPLEKELDVATIAADAALKYGNISQWKAIWEVIQENKEFGRMLMLKVAQGISYKKYEFMNELVANDFANLYIYLCKQFPYEDDQDFDGAHAIGPREQATHFRDGILSRLKLMGTWQACDAIKKIQQEFPQYEWLAYSAYEATQNALRNTAAAYPVFDIMNWGRGEVQKKQNEMFQLEGITVTTIDLAKADNKEQYLFREKEKLVEKETSYAFKDQAQVQAEEENSHSKVTVLHISDLHIQATTSYHSMLYPLFKDLTQDDGDGFMPSKIDYLVVSGDITSQGKKEEFNIAKDFIKSLLDKLRIPTKNCIMVPGNHDMDWLGVYQYTTDEGRDTHRRQEYIHDKKRDDAGKKDCYAIRDEGRYKERFANFRDFYKEVVGVEYPIEVYEEYIAFPVDSFGMQFLAFNSCWKIDQYNNQANINHDALCRCMLNISDGVQPVVRIAVMHHPVTGQESINNPECLEILMGDKVRLLLHGHVHTEVSDFVCRRASSGKIYIAGIGALGARKEARPESIPYLYSVMEIEKSMDFKVHVRRKLKAEGMWEGWYEWSGSESGQRKSYYEGSLI